MGEELSYTLLSSLSDKLGTSEQALRLLLSLLIGYPLLLVHKLYLKKNSPNHQHLYFIACGLFLAIFNYGYNFYHSVVCVLATWILLHTIGGTLMSVIIGLLFQMGYLLIGYHVTGTDTYDIKWTMPHCVLTLRLIALIFDVYDGNRKESDLSKDQLATALKSPPTLMEIASHTYFPASFLVGPQFSMKRYQLFIMGTLYPENTISPVATGLLRGLTGLLFLSIFQVGSIFFPADYLTSESYLSSSFPIKLITLGLWGKILLYKYVSCWLITEGICIFCGLSYNGKNNLGQPVWKGCANIKITRFETGGSFAVLITAFNINTNAWVMQYVYKRLRFLNNRYLSQIGALLFLALWHGFHSGYYACFFFEFIIIAFEKDLTGMLSKFPAILKFCEKPYVSAILFVMMRVYVTIFMAYAIGPFALLKSRLWWPFYTSCYFVGHVFFLSYWIYKPILKKILKSLNNALVTDLTVETNLKEE